MNDGIIFWNVDTQYDFMRKDGKLPVEDAQSIEETLGYITHLAEKNDIRVVSTRDWHTKGDEEISDNPDFVTTYPEHCMAETQGAYYVTATMPKGEAYVVNGSLDVGNLLRHRDIIINKTKFDVYAGNPNTEKLVEILDPQAIVVYGVATNVCVDQAVMGHRKRGIDVFVVEDAIKHLPHLDGDDQLSKEAIFRKWDGMNVQRITSGALENLIGAYK